jgi:hypothetical protein
MIKQYKIKMAFMLALGSVSAVQADVWTTTYDSALYNASGSITFNDWGYTGPNGATAADFVVPDSGGFDSTRVGQIQHVQTIAADLQTTDPGKRVVGDLLGDPVYTNASMDGTVNFYRWAYTTPTSNFNNMQIDRAGNYSIAREDMQFGFYDSFNYHDTTGANPDEVFDTNINFQPYAVSDARGWCGSTLVSNPNGLSVMAGQVSFDFAFDAYLDNNGPGVGSPAAIQVVPDFIMRSYGDYEVNVQKGSYTQSYTGHAVGNNTDPNSVVAGVGGTVDADYQNMVSFLGGGVVPKGVWVTADSYNPDGSKRLNPDGTWAMTIVSSVEGDARLCDPNAVGVTPEAGAICHGNSFAGYAFLLRADAERTLEWIAPEGHSDYVTTDPLAYASLAPVPVPGAVWLFVSGLAGLIGISRRNCASQA